MRVGVRTRRIRRNGIQASCAHPSGHEPNVNVLLVQSFNQVFQTGRKLERVLLKAILNVRLGRLDDVKAGGEGILELYIPIHCLGCPGGHGLAGSEVRREDVNSLTSVAGVGREA